MPSPLTCLLIIIFFYDLSLYSLKVPFIKQNFMKNMFLTNIILGQISLSYSILVSYNLPGNYFFNLFKKINIGLKSLYYYLII